MKVIVSSVMPNPPLHVICPFAVPSCSQTHSYDPRVFTHFGEESLHGELTHSFTSEKKILQTFSNNYQITTNRKTELDHWMDRFYSTHWLLNKKEVVGPISVPWFTNITVVTTHKKI